MALTQTPFNVNRITRTPTRQKLAVTVLSGGPSAEREVSLESGRAVAAALQSLGHKTYLEDIDPGRLAALARQVDCVFIALHGPFGEDGQVQDILERRGLAYTGSGPDACRLAMNKVRAKQRFLELGIPTPKWSVVSGQWSAGNLQLPHTDHWPLATGHLPVVIKPVSEGSSIHCYIIRDQALLRPAVERVVAAYGNCLIEQFIPGREITVGILGDRALPPIEIRTRREFYDYTAKYVDEDTEYDFDITLPQDLLQRLQDMSLAAHRALGCRDFSRLDWRVDDQCHQAYLLEANVIPGLTSHSLLPKAAAKAGLPMPEMCQFIIDQAIQRKFCR